MRVLGLECLNPSYGRGGKILKPMKRLKKVDEAQNGVGDSQMREGKMVGSRQVVTLDMGYFGYFKLFIHHEAKIHRVVRGVIPNKFVSS